MVGSARLLVSGEARVLGAHAHFRVIVSGHSEKWAAVLQCVRRHRLWACARFDVTVTSPRQATLRGESAVSRAAIVVSHAPSGITILETCRRAPRRASARARARWLLAAKPRLERERQRAGSRCAALRRKKMMRTQRRGLRPRILRLSRREPTRLAEAELQVAQAKFEGEGKPSGGGGSGSEAVVTAQPRSYASALRLPGRTVTESQSGTVLAIPRLPSRSTYKTAEETKLLKNAINPASMQVQVTQSAQGRSCGRGSTNHVCRIGGENSTVPPRCRAQDRRIKATVARCATCHRFGRRDAEARTASRIASTKVRGRAIRIRHPIWISVADYVSNRLTWAAP
ncbi:hypothetical protein EVAR_89967_1 [Eumeta japonica]|uniref:Uncharacterized protein n=1 Tax=Eumeta variegata TaxID=151549 RepID=A0A4C2AA50_EUMVA|nr:hypothetical protein EVAR_89967_1 [Eumeta japonica]